jgi:hypothetical protein
MVFCDTCDELVDVLETGDNLAKDGNSKGATFWLIN